MKRFLFMAAALLVINSEFFATNQTTTNEYGNEVVAIFIFLFFVLLFLLLNIALYVLVAKMAKVRKRSVILWVILSLFISPILSIILLYFVGEKDENSTNLID